MPFDDPQEDQDESVVPPRRFGYPFAGDEDDAMNPGAGSSATPVVAPQRDVLPIMRQPRLEEPRVPAKPSIGQQIVAMGNREMPPFDIQDGRPVWRNDPRTQPKPEIGQRIVGMAPSWKSQQTPLPNFNPSQPPRMSSMRPTAFDFNVSSGPEELFSSFIPAGTNRPLNQETSERFRPFSGSGSGTDRFDTRPSWSSRVADQMPNRRGINAVALSGMPQNSQQQQASQQGPPVGRYVTGTDSLTAENLKKAADYIKWRDQNFRPARAGGWEAPSGRLYSDEQLRTLYADQQQQAQWAEQARQRQRQATAQAQGRTVIITYPDGARERRRGNHPQRDNNPGNMEAGVVTGSHGQIGRDKAFAVFASPEDGWAALDALLRRSDYQGMSIDHAIESYAPRKNRQGKVINDTARYQAQVRAALGVTGGTRISSLTPEQFETLKQTIAQIEGFYEKRPNKKVDIVIEVPKRPNVIPRN